MSRSYHEIPIQFGTDRNLIGIHCRPAEQASPSSHKLPILIFSNTGLLRRTGPFRLWNTIARKATGLGLQSLRLDLSGLGDSAVGASASTDDQIRAQTDLRQGMDEMQRRTGCDRFILFGLCSSAYHSHHVAVNDPRVVGIFFLDGYAFRTLGFYFRHYLRLLDLPRIWRFIQRKLKPPAHPTLVPFSEGYSVVFPEQKKTELELLTLASRGTKLFHIHSGGLLADFNSARQFQEMYPRLKGHPRIYFRHFKKADHTYSFMQDRLELIAAVEQWLKELV